MTIIDAFITETTKLAHMGITVPRNQLRKYFSPSGRSQEIQRLIGRSLRSAINLKKIGEITIYIDCDVIQADGGTRSASITGSCIALFDALKKMKYNKLNEIIKYLVASVSIGISKEKIMIDLD